MTRAELVERMARAMCKAHGTGQCAALCLSHSSNFTRGGQCPEAPRIHDTAAALAAIEDAGCMVVERKLLTEAHACMRETGWHLANTCNYSGDGVLEAACSDVEERIRAMLAAIRARGEAGA